MILRLLALWFGLGAMCLFGCSTASPGQDRAPVPVTMESAPPAAGTVEAARVEVLPSPSGELATTLQPTPIVAIVELGQVDARDVEIAAESIRRHYGLRVEVQSARSLPASAYYAPRRRYRAEKLLDWLVDNRPNHARYVQGLTAADISTTKGEVEDWGICGLGEIDGVASVVSTFRIRKKLPAGTAQARQARYEQRLGDLVAHELGHVLGLPHCPHIGCIMEDARGTVTTFDRSTGFLCDDCRHFLEARDISIER